MTSGNIIATSKQSESPYSFPELGVVFDEKAIRKKWDKAETFLTSPTADPLKKVRRIYAFVDWLVSSSNLDKASVCKKGCHHCCYLDVDVSLLEAAYIARNTGYTQVMRESRIRKGYHRGRQYCGFLNRETGTCSIYEFRPLACRSFFAYDDPELCDKDEGSTEHAIFNIRAMELLGHIQEQMIAMGGGRYADVREWFAETTTDPYEGMIAPDAKFNTV